MPTNTPARSSPGTHMAVGSQALSSQSVLPLQSSSLPLKQSSAPLSTHGPGGAPLSSMGAGPPSGLGVTSPSPSPSPSPLLMSPSPGILFGSSRELVPLYSWSFFGSTRALWQV